MRIPAAIASLLLACALRAQDARVRASVDPLEITIGGHAVVSLSASADGPAITWPAVGDTLAPHIEVISASALDTTEVDGVGGPAAIMVVQRITITSFDTGYWAIPPFKLQAGGAGVETDPLLLRVNGFAVDSAAVPAPIKPIVRLPFSPLWWVRQHWTWVAGAAGILIAAALTLLLVRRIRRPSEPVAVPIEVPPLHQRILAQLDALEHERLWQQGQHKAYQSRLTDLLRAYIEERYEVPALERTTDELMHELRVSPMSSDHQALLANMLRNADLVKFAKWLPSPQENEQLMASARRFVTSTAITTTGHVEAQA